MKITWPAPMRMQNGPKMPKTSPLITGRKPLTATVNKYKRGVVAVVAGSDRYPGAAILTVGGARRGGAGYVKYFSKSSWLRQEIAAKFPDVVPIKSISEEKIDALVVGPGAVTLRKLPEINQIVLDGAAMKLANVLAKRQPSKSPSSQILVVTPHEGELKFLGYNQPKSTKEREQIARKIARELGVIVVLKGNKTLIAAPSGKFIVDSIGGPELATAGSGDVLAGLIGAFLASWQPKNHIDAQKVVAAAVKLHSMAGKHAAKRLKSVVATDLLESLAHC